MELNREIVREHFPEAVACHANLFVVEPGRQLRSYGLHHATSIGYEYKNLYDRGWFRPEFHKSFHTAVTPTDIDSSPFSMFDDHVPELMNLGHVLLYLRRRDEWRSDEERFLVHVAFTVFHQDLSYPPVKNHYKRSFMARRSSAEHLIATKALRCTATAWNLIVAQFCSAIIVYRPLAGSC